MIVEFGDVIINMNHVVDASCVETGGKSYFQIRLTDGRTRYFPITDRLNSDWYTEKFRTLINGYRPHSHVGVDISPVI